MNFLGTLPATSTATFHHTVDLYPQLLRKGMSPGDYLKHSVQGTNEMISG